VSELDLSDTFRTPRAFVARRRVHIRGIALGTQLAYIAGMRALVADDDRTTAAIVAKVLIDAGLTEVDIAEDGAAAWTMLNALQPPSLAVIDWTMPGLDGLELCRRVRNSLRLSSMYVLLLTAHERREDLIAGLNAGADDYMTKPVDLDELRARIRVGMRVVSLQENLAERVTALRRAHNRLQEMASTDALTELYSRRWWFDMATTEFSRSRRYDRDLSVLIIDLDHFKRVNDRFGHETGDAVLRTFAALLRRECRQSDIIGRLGGEEFAIALPETSVAQAQTLAARLTEGCRSISVSTPLGDVRWSCSVGVTQVRDDDQEIDGVLRRADTALYEAKRAGRDRWRNAA
jgi:two-component system, cell cycle response regulator